MRPVLEEHEFGNFAVVTVENPTYEQVSILARRFGFNKLEIEDCLSKRQLSKIDHYPDHLFTVLRFPVVNGNEKVISPVQLSAFLGEYYLVIVYDAKLRAVRDVIRELKETGNAARSPSFVFYKVIDRIIDDLFPILEDLMDDLERVEDLVFGEEIEAVKEVTLLRRRIAGLRRVIYPLRRVIGDLSIELQMRSKEDLSAYLKDLIDHVEKVWDVLEEAKEIVEIYKDTDFVLNTEKANKILAILTIIFTITIPATLIGTFYGMNIPLPLAHEPIPLLGQYGTFWLLTFISVAAGLFMLWYFKRIRWF